MLTLGLESLRKFMPRVSTAIAMPPSPIAVIEEVANRRQTREFVNFAWQIYRGDANWCPPLRLEAHAAINPRKHPFYLHGAASRLLARRNGQVVGRVLVSDDPNYNAEHGTNVGCFGLFETVNDSLVARSLLNSAAGWLRG